MRLASSAAPAAPARHSGVAPAASSKNAAAGTYVCCPRKGIASGLSGESLAISSALRFARSRLASLNSDAVTVPIFWPNFAKIARLYPDDAPAVVTLLSAKRTLARSPPDRTTRASSALLNERARSVSAFACSLVQIMAYLSVLRMFTFANRATGQPWLTELLWTGCPLPSLNAPPSSYVDAPPIMSSDFQNSGVFDW